mmetsp:Transcript_26025/g.72605  ORF Transcript_26025/g.72605 Transcript_26025/m.72605 type:complete len:243 (+) Transcript_26025:1572-2300(+)
MASHDSNVLMLRRTGNPSFTLAIAMCKGTGWFPLGGGSFALLVGSLAFDRACADDDDADAATFAPAEAAVDDKLSDILGADLPAFFPAVFPAVFADAFDIPLLAPFATDFAADLMALFVPPFANDLPLPELGKSSFSFLEGSCDVVDDNDVRRCASFEDDSFAAASGSSNGSILAAKIFRKCFNACLAMATKWIDFRCVLYTMALLNTSDTSNSKSSGVAYILFLTFRSTVSKSIGICTNWL